MDKPIDKPDADKLEAVLREKFGHDDFRPGQRDLIEAALQGRDVLATMSTGSGKSLCYQQPAVMTGQEGTTLVVSPLIALMRDQVGALKRKGVSAEDYHSGRRSEERERIMDQVAHGVYSLLYTSPEQLHNATFFERTLDAPIARVVVDEAHCISKWGHDFRPEYLHIRDYIVRKKIGQVMAFTATASANVKKEIRAKLGLREPYEYHGDLRRPNLFYDVVKVSSQAKKRDVIAQYIEIMAPEPEHGVLVYVSTTRDASVLCGELRKKGINAGFYHGKMDRDSRERVEEMFVNNEIQVMVATNAFGLGVDKPNIRMIIHHNMPGSIEAYIQETGRAGRDGNKAVCILLYNEKDRNVHDFFIREKTPEMDFVRSVYKAIANQYARSRQKMGGMFPLNRRGLYEVFVEHVPRRGRNGGGDGGGRSGEGGVGVDGGGNGRGNGGGNGGGGEMTTRRRDTQVNAAIDLMVKRGILEMYANYVKINPFPEEDSDSASGAEDETAERRMIAQANLEQVIRYANTKNPDQDLLLAMMEEEFSG